MAKHENLVVPSLAAASAAEQAGLLAQLERERRWYYRHRRFKTNADILQAAQAGDLRFVSPDANTMPVGRFHDPALFERFPPYLLPDSLLAVRAMGRLWRQRLEAQGIRQRGLRLAITSMARSEAAQALLAEDPTKLAVAAELSTHPTAGPYDTDASGYYLQLPDRLISIVHPDRPDPEVINRTLSGASSRPYVRDIRKDLFDPRVVDTFVGLADEMHRAGDINRVLEFKGTSNQCVHIAPNPSASWDNYELLQTA